MVALALSIVSALPAAGAPGVSLWSKGASEASAGRAGIRLASLWPASSSAWQPAYGDRFAAGFEASDGAQRFSGDIRAQAVPNHGYLATTGLFAVINHVSAICNLVRGQASRLLNPSAFGFQLHLNVAASLRRPGNGFVITFKF